MIPLANEGPNDISRMVAITAVIAALYASLTLLLAPISFYAIQVRIADALLALSIVMGPPAILGSTIGCFIANMLGPFGIVDAVGGSLANLVATSLAWKLRRNRLLALLQTPVTVSLIVSAYLHQILNLPFLELFLYVLVGSVIAIVVLGFAVLKVYEASVRRG